MRLIIYILLLCLAAWASYFVYTHPGDLELAYNEWVINMPIWLPVLGSVALLLVLMVSFSVISAINRLFRKIREWITGSNRKAVEENANQAWRALAEGDWTKAETKMVKAAKSTETTLHYYLAAARAAQELCALDRRDSYLLAALRTNPDARVAVGITQAELQLHQGQYEQSLAILQELLREAPHNKLVLRLAAEVYAALDDWSAIIKLLPLLRKHDVLGEEDFSELEVDAYTHLLRNEAKNSGKQALITCWDDLPRDLRNQGDVVYCYAHLLIGLNGQAEAELVIRNALKKQWDQALVKLYGLIIGPDLSKQITTAEGWLKNHPNDPALLLTLARLCVAHKLWGKARSYLETSISIETNPDTYAELGRLLDFLGEQQKSMECYKKGLLEVASVLDIER